MRHNLNKLGSDDFEHLVQALLKKVIGAGTITFGPGKDGAREATFTGSAPYPSAIDNWSGEWIFQAKFHDVALIGADKARAAIYSELHSELDKITKKYQTKCDHYILITNVPLSGVHKTGMRDRVQNEVKREYPTIKNIEVWDGNDVSRLLESNREIATAYAHLITPGDVISQLLRNQQAEMDSKALTVRFFLDESYKRDQFAQLEQAGEVSEDRLHLRKIFIDLNCELPPINQVDELKTDPRLREHLRELSDVSQEDPTSVLELFLSETVKQAVLIGGPGEGKSTLGQYLAQLHRAALVPLGDGSGTENPPVLSRIPFRVVLKDYAQGIVATSGPDDLPDDALPLDDYIAQTIARFSGRTFTTSDLHSLLAADPCLLILDGLDEVSERRVRRLLLDRLESFLSRCEQLDADVQILGTTRPNSYRNDFSSADYLHLRLTRLEPHQVKNYVERWISAKIPDEKRADRLREIINECLRDDQLSLLMTTPLQVTIMVLIVLAGGTPPKQKEALFAEYLEVIYKREKSKTRHTIVTEKQLLFGLHAVVGYQIHKRAANAENVSSDLDAQEYERLVEGFLRHNDPYSPADEIATQVRRIVTDAGERFVLIVEQSPGVHGFELRSIQEFFAAAHLCDTAKDTSERFKRFELIARHPHWRNVCLFFAGRVGRTASGEAANVLEVCKEIDRSGVDRFLSRGRWLALELAAERALGPNRSLQFSLIEYGLSLVESKNYEISDRALALLRRLPDEDVRDLVIPHATERLDVLLDVPALNLVSMLADAYPQQPGMQLIVEKLLRQPTAPKIDKVLQTVGHQLPATGAAKLWRQLMVEDRPEGMNLARRWFLDHRFWFLEMSDAAAVTSDEYQELYRGLNDGGSWTPMAEALNSAEASHVIYACVAAFMAPRGWAGAFKSHQMSPRLRRMMKTEDVAWRKLVDDLAAGDVDQLAAVTGRGWAPLVDVLAWAIHLSSGHVTDATLDRFVGLEEGLRFEVLKFVSMVSVYERGQFNLYAVLPLMLDPDHISDLSRRRTVARYLGEGGLTEWASNWAALETDISARNVSLSRLKAFGLEAAGSAALVDDVSKLTEATFGLAPDVVWEGACRTPELWLDMEDDRTQSDVTVLAGLVESWELPTLPGRSTSLKWARLPYIQSGRGATLDFRPLLDALALRINSEQAPTVLLAFGRILFQALASKPDDLDTGQASQWLSWIGAGKDIEHYSIHSLHSDSTETEFEWFWPHLCSSNIDEVHGACALLMLSTFIETTGGVNGLRRFLSGKDHQLVLDLGSGLRRSDRESSRAWGILMLVASSSVVESERAEIVEALFSSTGTLSIPVWRSLLRWGLSSTDSEEVRGWQELIVERLSSTSVDRSLDGSLLVVLEESANSAPPDLEGMEVELGLHLREFGASWQD